MTRAFQPLIPAIPTFTENGIACSDRYDDLYHSASGALEQANYVFLQGNGLPARWQGKTHFTILETGFGLGNNFLATWHAWRQDPARSERLHFVSFEAHPFYACDLATMLSKTPADLRPLVDQLLEQWPYLLPGIHRLEFEQGAVTLTLYFGDIQRGTRAMSCQADAFYLDGFAPRVNPAMWSKTVFGQLVRMAAPGATAATWCAASQVRKDLQDSGFLVKRVQGFGFKKQMTQAVLRDNLGINYKKPPTQPVCIIGGGIAGAAVAFSLAQRGIASTVYDPVFAIAKGAAHLHHDAVAMTALITSDDAPRARLSRAGILRAFQRWQSMLGQSVHICGSLQLAQSQQEDESLQKTVLNLGFDVDWVQYRDSLTVPSFCTQASKYGALYFPLGAKVYPEQLISQLLTHPLIELREQSVHRIQKIEGGWWLQSADGATQQAEHVVLANADGAKALLPSVLHQRSARFLQADVLGGHSVTVELLDRFINSSHVLCGNGYSIPLLGNRYIWGSTYTAPDARNDESANAVIKQKIGDMMPIDLSQVRAFPPWFGHRLALKDHLPVMDEAVPGLWVNAGFGSYGFSWAALAADTIAATLCAEPAVLERDLFQALALR